MKFVANYMVQTTFRVPREVQSYLLGSFENEVAMSNSKGDSVVGTWWVKWNTFHYVDQEKKIQSVEGDEDGDNFKYPTSVEEEEDSEAGSDSEGEETQ